MDNSERTGSRQGRSDGVHIREVGGPPGEAAGSTLKPDAGPARPPQPRHRPKPFRAAWIFTGILLGVGVLWAGGAFDAGPIPPSYATTVSVDPATGVPVMPDPPPLTALLRNLDFISPIVLLTGLVSTAALLITQGAVRSRELQQEAPTPAP